MPAIASGWSRLRPGAADPSGEADEDVQGLVELAAEEEADREKPRDGVERRPSTRHRRSACGSIMGTLGIWRRRMFGKLAAIDSRSDWTRVLMDHSMLDWPLQTQDFCCDEDVVELDSSFFPLHRQRGRLCCWPRRGQGDGPSCRRPRLRGLGLGMRMVTVTPSPASAQPQMGTLAVPLEVTMWCWKGSRA